MADRGGGLKTSSSAKNNKDNNTNKKKYYAVASGRKPGVYETWDECKKQVFSFPNAQHKVNTNTLSPRPFLPLRARMRRSLMKESLESDINVLSLSYSY